MMVMYNRMSIWVDYFGDDRNRDFTGLVVNGWSDIWVVGICVGVSVFW